MKPQSFKLFAMAFVLGLTAIFAAGSASAQTKLSFETSFDFHVGKEKLSAGKYELRKMDHGKYWLRNLETRQSRIVNFEIAENNADSTIAQRVTFNRYGDTYFLRSVFEEEKSDGKQLIESSYEKQIRRGAAARENRLAGEKAQPAKVSVNLSK